MELVNIKAETINGEEVNTVDARHLHEVLEIKKAFTTWIATALDNAGAVEGEDFVKLKTSLEGSGYKWEYHLTTDIAKHISLMSKVPKGREVRKYFIEVEKRHKQIQLEVQSKALEKFETMHKQVAALFYQSEAVGEVITEHEQRIRHLENSSTIDSRQQGHIQVEVGRRVVSIIEKHNFGQEVKSKLFARIYKMLKRHFEIGSYKDIPKARYDEAVKLIREAPFGGLL